MGVLLHVNYEEVSQHAPKLAVIQPSGEVIHQVVTAACVSLDLCKTYVCGQRQKAF